MERVIDLEGCLNFRDLGGYPTDDGRRVRWRRLFRSDALHLLTPGDVRRLCDELGVRDVVDLRSTAERRGELAEPLAMSSVTVHHVPLYDGEARSGEGMAAPFSLADRYFLLAEFAQARIAQVVRILARSGGSAVYHCAAGKDRTGVISAVLLGVLGVRDEVIVADYAATRENLDAIVARLMGTKGYQSMLEALPPDTMHAEPETMVALLEKVRERYGSMRGYARAAGLEDAVLARLEARLLEE